MIVHSETSLRVRRTATTLTARASTVVDVWADRTRGLSALVGVEYQAPVRQGRDVSRLHLQVMSVLRAPGRLKYLAGSESGVGAWINDVSPERVAARLREVG